MSINITLDILIDILQSLREQIKGENQNRHQEYLEKFCAEDLKKYEEKLWEIWQVLKEEIQLKANTNPSGSQQVFCDQFLACSEPRIKMDNQEEHVKIFLYACAILQNLGTIRADPGRFLLPFKLLQNVLSQELISIGFA